MMMMSLKDIDGRELEIANGSDIYYRDADGKDVHMEWSELDEESRERLAAVASRAAKELEDTVASFLAIRGLIAHT